MLSNHAFSLEGQVPQKPNKTPLLVSLEIINALDLIEHNQK